MLFNVSFKIWTSMAQLHAQSSKMGVEIFNQRSSQEAHTNSEGDAEIYSLGRE